MSVLLCKGQRDRLKLGRIAADVEPRKLEEPVRERLDLPLLGADRPQIARAGCLILRDAVEQRQHRRREQRDHEHRDIGVGEPLPDRHRADLPNMKSGILYHGSGKRFRQI